MPLTAYPEVNEVLSEFMRTSQEILGTKLLGIYLYGSLVSGDFDLDISDIDLLAVVSEPVGEEVFGQLHAMNHALARNFPNWEGRIEVAYVSESALKTFRFQKSTIAVISPGEPFHHKEAGNDWLLNWYVVRNEGVTLFGPEPEKFIEPISHEEFLQAVRRQAEDWADWVHHFRSRPGQAYAILTLCRAAHASATGIRSSKRQAALWAAERFPEWAPLIEAAVQWRKCWRDQVSESDEQATLPATVQFVRAMIAEIGRAGSP